MMRRLLFKTFLLMLLVIINSGAAVHWERHAEDENWITRGTVAAGSVELELVRLDQYLNCNESLLSLWDKGIEDSALKHPIAKNPLTSGLYMDGRPRNEEGDINRLIPIFTTWQQRAAEHKFPAGFLVQRQDTGGLVGYASIGAKDKGVGEFVMLLAPDQKGCGFGSAIATAMLGSNGYAEQVKAITTSLDLSDPANTVRMYEEEPLQSVYMTTDWRNIPLLSCVRDHGCVARGPVEGGKELDLDSLIAGEFYESSHVSKDTLVAGWHRVLRLEEMSAEHSDWVDIETRKLTTLADTVFPHGAPLAEAKYFTGASAFKVVLDKVL